MSDGPEDPLQRAVSESVAAAAEATALVRESTAETLALAAFTNQQADALYAAVDRSAPDRKRIVLTTNKALKKARIDYVAQAAERRDRIRDAFDRSQRSALVWVELAAQSSPDLRRQVVEFDASLEQLIDVIETDGIRAVTEVRDGLTDEPHTAGARELAANADAELDDMARGLVALKFMRMAIRLALSE
jgi:hypothetical protein